MPGGCASVNSKQPAGSVAQSRLRRCLNFKCPTGWEGSELGGPLFNYPTLVQGWAEFPGSGLQYPACYPQLPPGTSVTPVLEPAQFYSPAHYHASFPDPSHFCPVKREAGRQEQPAPGPPQHQPPLPDPYKEWPGPHSARSVRQTSNKHFS